MTAAGRGRAARRVFDCATVSRLVLLEAARPLARCLAAVPRRSVRAVEINQCVRVLTAC